MIRDRNQTNLFSTKFPGHKVAAITVAQENSKFTNYNTTEISDTVERNKTQGYGKSGLANPSPEGTHPRLLQIGLSKPKSRRDTPKAIANRA